MWTGYEVSIAAFIFRGVENSTVSVMGFSYWGGSCLSKLELQYLPAVECWVPFP